ncbi:MAG: hypothetical protein HYV09_30890 [Deltaproteobacteria bacterium]|nr:hypothetical protein [Deltaproteobacteria bacterium]
MKFKTFRMIVIAAAGVVGVGVLFGVSTCCKSAEKKPPLVEKPHAPVEKPLSAPADTTAKVAPTVAPTAAATTAAPLPEGALALRPMDGDILARLAQPMSGDKVKDAFPGRSYKVNLYKEGPGGKPDRLKLDLDRDDKWDEKWSVEQKDGQEVIKRQVAPADDEKYTEEYRLSAGAWVPKKK